MNTNANKQQQILRSSEAARLPVKKMEKERKERLLINSIKLRIQGEIFVHASFKGINSVAIHNVWAQSIPCIDDSVEKEVHRFV